MVRRKYNVVIIGGGFWGCIVALTAQEQGYTTLVIDNGDERGSSRNAAGIICRHWYKQKTIRQMTPDFIHMEDIDEGIEYLQKFGLTKTGELFTSYQHDREKFRPDCYLIPSCNSVFSQVSIVRNLVESIDSTKTGVCLNTLRGTQYLADWAIVTAGAFTDQLLQASGFKTIGVTGLRGRALVYSLRRKLPQPVTHLVRPYTHLTLRPWGEGQARLGDSVERTDSRGDRPLEELREAMSLMNPKGKEVKVLDGLRPLCKQFTVEKVGRRVIAASGGHRVGLALSRGIANQVMRLIRK